MCTINSDTAKKNHIFLFQQYKHDIKQQYGIFVIFSTKTRGICHIYLSRSKHRQFFFHKQASTYVYECGDKPSYSVTGKNFFKMAITICCSGTSWIKQSLKTITVSNAMSLTNNFTAKRKAWHRNILQALLNLPAQLILLIKQYKNDELFLFRIVNILKQRH